MLGPKKKLFDRCSQQKGRIDQMLRRQSQASGAYYQKSLLLWATFSSQRLYSTVNVTVILPQQLDHFGPEVYLCTSVPAKIKKYFFDLKFKLELELNLEWLEIMSKTLGRLVYFAPYL